MQPTVGTDKPRTRVGARRNVKLWLNDADGDLVRFSLSGPGRGEIVGGSTSESVNLEGTTRSSKLTIRTSRREETSVGNVAVADSIGRIDAGTTDLRDSLTVGGSLRRLDLHDIAGDVTVGTYVRTVRASGAVTGSVTAGTFVGTVKVGGDVDGDITANDGDIRSVTAGGPRMPGSVTGALSASRDVRTVRAYGDLTEDITAGRDVRSVSVREIVGTAGDRVSITAGRDVRTVKARGSRTEPGNIQYVDIDADRDLRTVNAKHDVANSAITAGRRISAVTARNDIISTQIESGTAGAGGNVGRVIAKAGSLDANVTSGGAIGRVEARRGSITGDLVANGGDLRSVLAGTGSVVGSVTGTLTASGRIHTVRASGDIVGDVTAGAYVRTVRAGGTVTGSVTAGTFVGTVKAGGDVAADVTANDGDIRSVAAGSSWMPGGVLGALRASRDVKNVRARGDLTGDITAGRNVSSVAAREIVGTAGDYVSITAGRDVRTVKTTGSRTEQGNIRYATIDADRDVRTVRAKQDHSNSGITAGRNIMTAKAANDNEDTRVESGMNVGGGYIGKVQALRGNIVDPQIVAGRDAGPDGVYGSGATDDVVRSGRVKRVNAPRGLITSSDATEDFIVAATSVGIVKDRRGRHAVSWDETAIVEG